MALILLCMFCWALWCVRFCVFVARLQRPSSPVQRKAKGINVRHQRGVSAHKHKPRAVQRLSEKWVSKRAKKRRKQWKSSVCFRVFVWRDISMGATDPIMIEYFIALTHPLALRSSSKLGGSISSHHQQRSGSFFFFWPCGAAETGGENVSSLLKENHTSGFHLYAPASSVTSKTSGIRNSEGGKKIFKKVNMLQ